jgi:hypothetical protein
MARELRSNIKDAERIKASPRRYIRDIDSDMHVLNEEYTNRAMRRVESMRNAFYGGIDPRRRQEAADGGMVREDNNAMANLSEQFVHREYPRVPYYANPFIDDAIEY